MRMRILLSLLTITLLVVAEETYYSSINSELFISPNFLATGSSQQALTSDASPKANPATLTRSNTRSITLG